MLTRALSERQPLDLYAPFGRAQRLAGCELGQVRRGNPHVLGEPLCGSAPAGLDECFEFHERSVEDTKSICQELAISSCVDDTSRMEIKEIRRSRLKAWFANRTLPKEEKSYLSQLMGGKIAFGEKAARRLEQSYGMPAGHLDRAFDGEAPEQHDDKVELLGYWNWLTRDQRGEFMAKIKERADYNRTLYEQFAPKDAPRRNEHAAQGATIERRKGAVWFGFPDRRQKREANGEE